ncbi:MAG: hypothetical protein L0Y58_12045 [Verrucomicrobia subdivision 3 bacterium]|nr:hypothetical protein [Limisphaerales bacterium]
MIRPLRQKHRLTVCALGVALPVALVAGIAARRSVPPMMSLPPELTESALTPGGRGKGHVVWTKADVWPGQRIVTTLRRDGTGAIAVEFMFRELVKPDVLVYWAPGKEIVSAGLPENARLLGALADRAPLPISVDVRGEAGQFVLYSLAEQEIVATSKPLTIQKN